ncbi:hypothetical protein V6N13_001852 [Hibiscus sabdariffa]
MKMSRVSIPSLVRNEDEMNLSNADSGDIVHPNFVSATPLSPYEESQESSTSDFRVLESSLDSVIWLSDEHVRLIDREMEDSQ